MKRKTPEQKESSTRKTRGKTPKKIKILNYDLLRGPDQDSSISEDRRYLQPSTSSQADLIDQQVSELYLLVRDWYSLLPVNQESLYGF